MKVFFFSFLTTMALMQSCKNAPQYNDPIPKHETFNVESKLLGEPRVINIWKPEGYVPTDSDTVNVLFMLDGGIKEDFPHVANTLDTLVKGKKIQPIILVGIENTQRRRDLTGPTTVKGDKEIAPVVGGSAQFSAFVRDELFPEINSRLGNVGKRGIIGESLAGLFVTETFLENPNMFDFYIAFDPSLWWNDRFLVKHTDSLLNAFPQSQKVFWFAGSNAEDISGNTDTLSKILTARNLPNLVWQFSNEKGETHKTIFRATKEKALVWALNSLGL